MPGSTGQPDAGGAGTGTTAGDPGHPHPALAGAEDAAPRPPPEPDDAAAALRLALDQLSALGLGGARPGDEGMATRSADGATERGEDEPAPPDELEAAVAPPVTGAPSMGVGPSMAVAPSVTSAPSIALAPSVTCAPCMAVAPSVTVAPSMALTPSVTLAPTMAVASSVAPGGLPLLDPDVSPRPSPPDVFASFAPHPAALGPSTLLAEQLNVIGSRKKSVNMTECVPVPSSEHVAEIVGRQGECLPSGGAGAHLFSWINLIGGACVLVGGRDKLWPVLTQCECDQETPRDTPRVESRPRWISWRLCSKLASAAEVSHSRRLCLGS